MMLGPGLLPPPEAPLVGSAQASLELSIQWGSGHFGRSRMRETLQAELAQAIAELKAHMATWEYALAMAGGRHGSGPG